MKRRKKDKLAGLKPGSHRRGSRDFVDFDYVEELTDDEKVWLEKFAQEYYRAYFENDGGDLHPEKSPERKICYDANNARNRDLWNQRNRNRFPDEDAFAEDEDGK